MAIRTIDLDLGGTEKTLPLPVEAGPPGPERLNAVLRWRSRWLRSVVNPRTAQGLRLIPVLLQASLPLPDLRGEAPGIEGATLRRSAAILARAFELPVPIARQRGRRLVSAVLAAPLGDQGVEVLVVAAPGTGTAERERLEARVAAIEEILRGRSLLLRFAVLEARVADLACEPLLHLVAFGALLAGRLPSSLWDRPERSISPEALAALIERAPTPLCAHAMCLMLAGAVPDAVGALRSALSTLPSRALAHPDVLAAHWAGQSGQEARLVQRALEMSRPDLARRAPTPGEVLKLGRQLALAELSALRRAPRTVRTRLRAFARREVIAHGVPSLLVPALGRAWRAHESIRRDPPLTLRRRGRHCFEACDAAGSPLGRGATAEQALLRAVAPVAQALGEVPALDDPAWTALGDRLARKVSKRSLLLVVRSSQALGAPHDPLNRGPERALGFADALAITLRPTSRPTAQRLSALQAVEQLLREAARGALVEAVPLTGDSHPAAGRLMRLAALVKTHDDPARPLALEAGGQVLWFKGARMRRHRLRTFAARPRLCAPDPEAPDLSPWAEDKVLQSPFGGYQPIVTCHVSCLGDECASILYLDPQGFQLHEEVPLLGLEEHLTDAQALLRARPSPMLLMVRYTKEIEAAVPRWALAGGEVRVNVEVHGELPFGLQVDCLGERFGARAPLGWDAAAQAVLSAWPSGAQGLLTCKLVSVDVWGRPAAGLARLYARSAALRRLQLHVGRACRA